MLDVKEDVFGGTENSRRSIRGELYPLANSWVNGSNLGTSQKCAASKDSASSTAIASVEDWRRAEENEEEKDELRDNIGSFLCGGR